MREPRQGSKDIDDLERLVSELIRGRSNAQGSFTLTPGVAVTVVVHKNITPKSKIVFSPRTANAAASLSVTYISNIQAESFTLTHANNAQTDRTFDYIISTGET